MSPDRTTPPEVRAFDNLVMPPEQTEILSNGMTLHLLRGGDQPVCSLDVLFAGGIAELTEAKARMTILQMTERTAAHSAEELSEIKDFNGARLSGKTTSHHSMLQLFALTHHFADMLPLIGEMMTAPAFDSDRLEVAVARAVSDLQTSRLDPSTLAWEAMLPLVWGIDNPLALKVEESDYMSLDTAVLADTHRHLVCPRRTHVFLAGQFTEDIADAVRNMLESVPAKHDGTDIILTPAAPAPGGTKVAVPFESSLQSAISLTIPAIPRSHPDYIPLRLTVMALGGYFGSRLMTNIREEKGLTYGINASLMGELQGSYVSITAKCDKNNTDIVLAETEAEIRRLVSEPPCGEELERMRIYAATSLAKTLDTPQSMMQYYQNMICTGTPHDYFTRQFKCINALTPDMIARIAAEYLRPDSIITVVAGNKGNL